MGPPFRTFWKSWFEEQGGYIMPGNRQRGSSDRVLVGSSRRGTAGQFRRIVVNKSVVKPSCDFNFNLAINKPHGRVWRI